MKKTVKWLMSLGGITLLLIFIKCVGLTEGFQGQQVPPLFPMEPFIPRKDSSRGTSLKSVPLVIYHSWGTATVPSKMYEHVHELIEANPEFDYSFNTDEICRQFIVDYYEPEVVKAFDCLRPGAFKSDLWRYCVLYKKGGVYIDIKNKPVKKLIDVIENYNIPLFVQDAGEGSVWNGFMIAAPGEAIFKECIDTVVRNVKQKYYGITALHITGPGLLGEILGKLTPGYRFEIRNRNYVLYDRDGSVFAREYQDYRSEQKRFQKTKHYSEIYRRREVFDC